MGLIDDAVAVANDVTLALGLQALVTWEAFVQVDGYGKKTFAPAVQVRAVVEMKQRSVKTGSGELDMSQASVLFLDPSLVISTNDRITLSNGVTGPILTMEGVMSPATGQPALTQVYLG